MDWLFERIIELAAWVAFIFCIVLLLEAVWMLVHWVRNYGDNVGLEYLAQAGESAAGFVLSALALGCLACIDRYVFDTPEN